MTDDSSLPCDKRVPACREWGQSVRKEKLPSLSSEATERLTMKRASGAQPPSIDNDRLVVGPDALCNIKFQSWIHIRSLEMTRCELTSLPEDLSLLINLTKLDISFNQLEWLPKCLEACRNLQVLVAAHNQIQSSDGNALDWINISSGNHLDLMTNDDDGIYSNEELSMTDNLKEKPRQEELNFTALGNLHHIDLSHNELTHIPDSLQQHEELIHMDLSFNKLRSLPRILRCHEKLKHLHVDGNEFPDLFQLPKWFMRMKRCSVLSFAFSNLEDIIDEITPEIGDYCQKILKLDFRNSNVERFPNGITSLLDLEILCLGNESRHCCRGRNCSSREDISWTALPADKKRNNVLSSLPSKISHLKSLEHLDVSNVALSQIPSTLWDLTRLKHLDLSHNSFPWLPAGIEKLANLEYLNVSNSQLILLPTGFDQIPTLKHLLLQHNQLADVHDMLKNLQQLETLDLYDNNVSEPIEIDKLPKLIRMDLSGNPLSHRIIVEKLGEDVIKQYLELQSNMRTWYSCPHSDSRSTMPSELTREPEDFPASARVKTISVSSSDSIENENKEHWSVLSIGQTCQEEREDLSSISDSSDWSNNEKRYQFSLARQDSVESLSSSSKPCPTRKQTNFRQNANYFCPADDHPSSYRKALTRKEIASEITQQYNPLESKRFGRTKSEAFTSKVLHPCQFDDCEDDFS